MIYDFCIIGGGIVGLATAMKLLEMQPGARLVLIEKEAGLATHQTGHNSGVIHSGIYYAPGSLKARLCREGAEATKAFCWDNDIPIEVCGKLLVATNQIEMKRMGALLDRAKENGIEAEQIDAQELSRREPNISGLGALWVPATGIVDYRLVCAAMSRRIASAGGEIITGVAVDAIKEHGGGVTIAGGGKSWAAKRLVACAGLQSDRLARLAGMEVTHQIIPFRGEYFRLPAARNDVINSLIYPVPNPDLPFLGIHLTRMMDGSVTVGPNAVLGFSREGYDRLSMKFADVMEYARFPGFWRTIAGNFGSAVTELRNSLWTGGYLQECRKYCPSLTLSDLLPYPAGIRAQAVMRDGTLVHDFLFLQSERMLHVCNAPSPAATSAIPIGEMIAKKSLKGV